MMAGVVQAGNLSHDLPGRKCLGRKLISSKEQRRDSRQNMPDESLF
jgi:hypothetical protein